MDQVKESNPKDMVAIDKLPLHLVPPSLVVYAAIGFAEGAFKYGAYNYRPAGVSNSVYYSALLRHMFKWWNGEDKDPVTGVPHLANAVSCLGIIIDGAIQGTLKDDRPPKQGDFSQLVDNSAEDVKRLRELFKEFHPTHYTQEYMNGRKEAGTYQVGSPGQERKDPSRFGSVDARRPGREVPPGIG